jgi:hypothetical protein
VPLDQIRKDQAANAAVIMMIAGGYRYCRDGEDVTAEVLNAACQRHAEASDMLKGCG